MAYNYISYAPSGQIVPSQACEGPEDVTGGSSGPDNDICTIPSKDIGAMSVS